MAGVVVKAPFPKRTRASQAARNGLRYLLSAALRNWIRNFASTGPALGTMTMLLLLSGVVALLGLAGHNLAVQESADAALLHIYLRDGASTSQVQALEAEMRAAPHVKSVSYVSKAQALARAEKRPGLGSLAAASDSNPFPAEVDVQATSVSAVAALDARARRSPAVDPVTPTSYNQDAYQKIEHFLFGATVVGVAFLLLLGFIALTVTANSIRAAIHARRDEVKIMQLVGAPRWMVRGPFLLEGALTGGIAGALAGCLVFLLALAAVQAGASTFAQFAPGVSVFVGILTGFVIFLVGLSLGSGASFLSLRRHLEV